MALRSMTGYGRAQGQVQELELIAEVRSVNHKGLDIKLTTPGTLAGAEAAMLRLVRQHLQRGRVQVKISLGAPGAGSAGVPVVDTEAAAELYRRLDGLAQKLGIIEAVSLETLLRARDVVLRDPNEVELSQEAWPQVLDVLEQALRHHVAERDREGSALAEDLRQRLRAIAGHVEAIAALVPQCQEEYLEKLRERVTEAAARFGLGEIPEERLLQEVVLYADRSDISEELTRARTHVTMLLRLIEEHNPAQDGPVGKKLDFYLQELIRETNTTGSKSQSAQIAGHVVEIRSEIDRLREQALNVS